MLGWDFYFFAKCHLRNTLIYIFMRMRTYKGVMQTFAASVNVAISQISSATNIITLLPYILRLLFGPLHRFINPI